MTNTPTKFSISAAAQKTGKSRTTITKHVKEGKLSYELDHSGAKLIDLSELLRCYPEASDRLREEGARSSTTRDKLIQPDPPGADAVRAQLEKEVAERERERRQLQDRIESLEEALERSMEGHNRAMLLLEDRSGGGEWRQAITDLEARLTARETEVRKAARREAITEIKSRPWWKLLGV